MTENNMIQDRKEDIYKVMGHRMVMTYEQENNEYRLECVKSCCSPPITILIPSDQLCNFMEVIRLEDQIAKTYWPRLKDMV